MSKDEKWTLEDSREAFLGKEADECYDIFLVAFPERLLPGLGKFIEWAMSNNLAGATAACYYLATLAEEAGLFERHAKHMNAKNPPKNPWAAR